MKTKPKKCCHPNCFDCPYKDCRWQEMTSQDFSESNSRDYELFESATGWKYHKGTDKEYRNLRQMAYRSEHPVKEKELIIIENIIKNIAKRSNDSKKKIMTHERILNLVANGARKT